MLRRMDMEQGARALARQGPSALRWPAEPPAAAAPALLLRLAALLSQRQSRLPAGPQPHFQPMQQRSHRSARSMAMARLPHLRALCLHRRPGAAVVLVEAARQARRHGQAAAGHRHLAARARAPGRLALPRATRAHRTGRCPCSSSWEKLNSSLLCYNKRHAACGAPLGAARASENGNHGGKQIRVDVHAGACSNVSQHGGARLA